MMISIGCTTKNSTYFSTRELSHENVASGRLPLFPVLFAPPSVIECGTLNVVRCRFLPSYLRSGQQLNRNGINLLRHGIVIVVVGTSCHRSSVGVFTGKTATRYTCTGVGPG